MKRGVGWGIAFRIGFKIRGVFFLSISNEEHRLKLVDSRENPKHYCKLEDLYYTTLISFRIKSMHSTAQ